jgi:hypothetical protein
MKDCALAPKAPGCYSWAGVLWLDRSTAMGVALRLLFEVFSPLERIRSSSVGYLTLYVLGCNAGFFTLVDGCAGCR